MEYRLVNLTRGNSSLQQYYLIDAAAAAVAATFLIFFFSYFKSFFTKVIFWSLIQNVVADFVMCPCHTRLVDIFTQKKVISIGNQSKKADECLIVIPAQISVQFCTCFHNIASARWANCSL